MGDNDPIRFWTYVVTACQSVDQRIGELALALLLEHLPNHLRLIVSTRVDPSWSQARFCARAPLVEIRAADLRFTTEEAAALLKPEMGLSLRPEDITTLEAALNAGLCDYVDKRSDSCRLLNDLQRANLFVLALDDEGQWFRYHHLFGDLLKAHLHQTVPSAVIAVLRQCAASWYEQHECAAEAIHHRLAAKDLDEAARLIGQNASGMLRREALATMQWIKELPADVTPLHPPIIIAKIWVLTLVGPFVRSNRSCS